MNFADLELLAIELPARAPHPAVRTLLVRLSATNGLEGWGECPWSGRSQETRDLREQLASLVQGRAVHDVEELLSLEGLSDTAVRGAVEMASWDLIGRAARQPLCNLWGGMYRRRMPVAARLPDVPPPQAIALARELADDGMSMLVVPALGEAEADVEQLAQLRGSVAGRARLWLDAGGRYTPRTYRELTDRLPADGVRYVVDPLPASRRHDLARLVRRSPFPVALSRGLKSLRHVGMVSQLRGLGAVQLRLDRTGGLSSVRASATIAGAAGREALLRLAPSSGIAVAAMIHLACSTPVCSGANECGYHQLADDVLSEPLRAADGLIAVPQGAGLGVEIDRHRLERYQVG